MRFGKIFTKDFHVKYILPGNSLFYEQRSKLKGILLYLLFLHIVCLIKDKSKRKRKEKKEKRKDIKKLKKERKRNERKAMKERKNGRKEK